MSEPSGVVLRRATASDHVMVGEITVAAYAEFTEGPDDGYVAMLRDAAARDREAELWIAEREGTLLGSVTLALPGSSWRQLAADDEGEFRMLAVAPAARRQGVGEALVRLADQRFRDLGLGGVVLSSLAEMTGAHRIYERLGYLRRPDRDWSPHPGVRLIAYHREL